jgi:hypothetical protein
MSDSSKPVIYQLKVVLLGISPMIWRRLKVSSDSTIEDLHYTLQIAMGWEDIHLHHFIIYGKQYGITQPGGIIFSDRGGSDAQAFWRLLSVASPLLVTSILDIGKFENRAGAIARFSPDAWASNSLI